MVSFWVPYEWFSLCTLWSVTLCCLMNDSPCVPYGTAALCCLMNDSPYVPYGTAALCYLMGYFPFAPYDTAALCDPYETVFLMSLW